MKLLILVLVLACLGIQYPLWLGDNGKSRVSELKQQLSSIEQKNKALDIRNQAMQAEILDIKEGTEAIEERARTELNMIKENEVLVQVLHSDEKDLNVNNKKDKQ